MVAISIGGIPIDGGARSPSDMIVVPFEFHRDSIIVQVKVGGRGPFAMLLDTGVDPSVIDLATARSLGLPIAAKGGQGTGSGSEVNLAYDTRLRRVELGELAVDRIAALATDLSRTRAALGRPIVGVLGYSLLKARIVQFDYRNRIVRFLRRAPARANGTAARTTVPFRYRDEILVDDVAIDGRTVVANLDTGSNAHLQMAPAAVRALGLERAAAAGAAVRSTGINGATENRAGRVDRIRIGTMTMDDVPMVFLGADGGHDDERWSVRIGNGFLKAYLVTVDYRNHRITLEAEVEAEAK